MSELAIRCNSLSKQYRIGKREKYRTLRETLAGMARLPQRLGQAFYASTNAGPTESNNLFWALREVAFEIPQGQVVGIIGRNGAGKSTLLKILSRITEPSIGTVEILGRVGSLLEVGTGFHNELTGRENVFLNGAILGMRKAEIESKFEAIVAFAEVEKFLDTPVKHYSSGMHMRLAFAVAAHLEPEVLLVDEVLAVGDASFQRKCLHKMEEVGKEGRTVLFVSHNMPAVTRLCERAILLDAGTVIADGPAHQVVTTYLRSGFGSTALREWPDDGRAPGNEVVRLHAARVKNASGALSESIDIRCPVFIELEYEVLKPDYILVPNFHFFNEDGLRLFISSDLDPAWRRRPKPVGKYLSTVTIPGNYLAEGTIIVGVAISTMDPVIVHFYEADAVAFQVIDSLDGDSARGDYAGPFPGVVRPWLEWRTVDVGKNTARAVPHNSLLNAGGAL